MKLKNKILAIGTTLAIVSPIAAVISCGTVENKNKNDGVDSLDFTNKINGAPSMYQKEYNYDELLSKNASSYNADTGELTVDVAALRKFPASYPIDHNEFNAEAWGNLTKESVKQQLIKNQDPTNPIDINEEMKKVASNSAPLTIQTDVVYYPFFSTSAPDSNGSTQTIEPGFYHIRPESSADILADHSKTSWNSIGTTDTSLDFKNKLKQILNKNENKNLAENDQLLLNVNSDGTFAAALTTLPPYTYYENYYDDSGNAHPLTNGGGFFITKPLNVDGRGVSGEYKITGDQNRLNFDTVVKDDATGKSKGSAYKIRTYDTDAATKTLIPHDRYLFPDANNGKNPSTRIESFDGTFNWDGPAPVIFKHFLKDKQEIKLNNNSDVKDLFSVTSTNKDKLQFLQPDSRWISPSSGMTNGKSISTSVLTYNDHRYKLTRFAKRISGIYQNGYFYNPVNLRYLNTDSLNWIDADESADVTSQPTALQKLLLSKKVGHLDGFDGNLKAYFGTNTLTMYTKYTDGSNISNELQGFYKTRPLNKNDARTAMFNYSVEDSSGDAINDLKDEDQISAIPYDITKIGAGLKIADGSSSVPVHYWTPKNLDDLRIELLYGAAEKYKTNSGFELTGMISKDQSSFFSSTLITQQDRGFSPLTNQGSWESTMSTTTSGSETNLYKYADFIEKKNSDDFYYQHEYFNYEDGVKIDLKDASMTSAQREKYRLPSILRGFYKNDTKLDYKEYKNNPDKYIQDSLSSKTAGTLSQHDKLIFNGLNGSTKVTTYKGVIYPNKAISGLVAHTSWSPKLKEDLIVYAERQSADWIRSFPKTASATKIAKPDDYFNLNEVNFGHNIVSSSEVVKSFLGEIAHVPFENLKTIHFVWNNEDLATISNITHPDFQKVMEILKDSLLFTGNITTVIKNIGYKDGMTHFEYNAKKQMALALFGEDLSKYSNSLMGKLAAKLKEYTIIKQNENNKQGGIE